jgi:hypothetical protein
LLKKAGACCRVSRLGDVLPVWIPGTLDIHQIVTGRGNAAHMMFPDGTTLLLDAGDAGDIEYDRLDAPLGGFLATYRAFPGVC